VWTGFTWLMMVSSDILNTVKNFGGGSIKYGGLDSWSTIRLSNRTRARACVWNS